MKIKTPIEDIIELATFHNLDLDTANYLCRNTSPKCKCGKIKLLVNSAQSLIGKYLKRTCGNTICEPKFGISRPEHSKKMKFLSKNGSELYQKTLMQPGKLFNTEVNSVNFKRSRLRNNGIECDFMSDDEILKAYSKFRSDYSKSVICRKKQIIQRFNNWEDEFTKLILLITNNIIPTTEWLDTLPDDEIQRLWTRIHGVNTIRNNTRIKKIRPSFFKHEILTGFKFNRKLQENIYVKSGFEKSFIEFFEETGIWWEYETIRIETINKDGFHIPDFLIEIDSELILFETKGGFYNQPLQDYYENKILAAMNYSKENGLRYILTQKNPDKDFNFIKNALIDSKDNINVKD
jgi:Fe-S-cluster containining protein